MVTLILETPYNHFNVTEVFNLSTYEYLYYH